MQWDCQQLANLRPRRIEEKIIRMLIALRELLDGCCGVTVIESCKKYNGSILCNVATKMWEDKQR